MVSRKFLWGALASSLLAAACAGSPATPGESPGAALIHALRPFADPRNMTIQGVARVFHTAPVKRGAEPLVFRAIDWKGEVHLDSIELSDLGEAVELDIFPGADCITRRDGEAALGSNPIVRVIAGDGGRQLIWRLPAVLSRAWAEHTYELSAAFAGQDRCITQITIRHMR